MKDINGNMRYINKKVNDYSIWLLIVIKNHLSWVDSDRKRKQNMIFNNVRIIVLIPKISCFDLCDFVTVSV